MRRPRSGSSTRWWHVWKYASQAEREKKRDALMADPRSRRICRKAASSARIKARSAAFLDPPPSPRYSHDAAPRLRHGPPGGAFALADDPWPLVEDARISGAYELKDLTPEAFPAFIGRSCRQRLRGWQRHRAHKEAAFRLVDKRDAAAERSVR